MQKRNIFDDIMVCLLLFMQMGFHTNSGYDDTICLLVTGGIFLYFAFCKGNRGLIHFSRASKEYIIWYTSVTSFCCASYFWATNSNIVMIRDLVINTYVPLMLTVFCLVEYTRKKQDGINLLVVFIYAEIFVAVRALMNTPMVELLTSFNTRVYGTGLGVNYNHFTTQYALAFCVALFLSFSHKKKYYWHLGFILLNIVLSGSRKVLIVSLICFIIIYVMSAKRDDMIEKFKRVIAVTILLVAVFWVVMTNEFLYQLIGQKTYAFISQFFSYTINELDYSYYQRSTLIEIARSVFVNNPIVGVGYYCFIYYNQWGVYAHNNYYELLADLGIIGFILYYWFYFKQLWVALLKSDSKHIIYTVSKHNTLVVAFIITLMIMEYGHVSFFRPYVLTPLLVMYLAVDNMRKNNKNNISKKEV